MTDEPVPFTEIINDVECTLTPINKIVYTNCAFESGRVEGHPYDTSYLKVSREGFDTITFVLCHEEVLALLWVLSGTLWQIESEKE